MKLQHETPPEIANLREKLVVSFHFQIFSHSVEQVAYLKMAFWASNPMWCQQRGYDARRNYTYIYSIIQSCSSHILIRPTVPTMSCNWPWNIR